MVVYLVEDTVKFLIVDDLAAMRRVFKRALSIFDLGDFIEATNGIEALKVFDSSVGFVITDADMPEMDGVQLIRELRAREEGAQVPILMVSGNHACIARALQAGANGFVQKPFTLQELRQGIEEILAAQRG